MASKIGKGEWKILFVAAGVLDLIEFFSDLLLTEAFAIPEIVWTVVDRIVGVVLVAYFEMRGVKIFADTSRLLSLIGVQGIEFISGGAAPAWIIDIWYIHRTVMAEDAARKEEEEIQEALRNFQLPLNSIDEESGEGMRPPQYESADELPDTRTRPPQGGQLYSNGIGKPRR